MMVMNSFSGTVSPIKSLFYKLPWLWCFIIAIEKQLRHHLLTLKMKEHKLATEVYNVTINIIVTTTTIYCQL